MRRAIFGILLPLFVSAPWFPAARAEPPILRISLEDEPSTLDWNFARTPSERFLASFLARGLLQYDSALHPICDLCRSFQILNGGKTYRFEVNTSIAWSDGTPLEANHFIAGFRRLTSSGNHAHPVAAELANASGFRAPSKDVFEIELKKPLSTLPHLLTLVQTRPYHPGAFIGPYLVAAWEKGRRIVVEGNPGYLQPRPVYRVEFILGNHEELLQRFAAGKLDVFANPTTEEVMKNKHSRLQLSHSWATRCLLFNNRKSPVSNPSMRRAVAGAIERSSLPSLLKNGEKTATGLIPPGLPGFSEEAPGPASLEQIQGDRHRAVPWPRWIDLELLLRDEPVETKVATWLSEQLGKVHVKLRTKTLGAKEYYSDLEAGRFDLALLTEVYETASPLDLFGHFQSRSKKNWGGWANSAFDILLDRVSRANADLAKETLTQLKDIVESQDPAVVPLTFPAHGFMLNSRVASFAMTPFGDPDLLRIDLKTQSGQKK